MTIPLLGCACGFLFKILRKAGFWGDIDDLRRVLGIITDPKLRPHVPNVRHDVPNVRLHGALVCHAYARVGGLYRRKLRPTPVRVHRMLRCLRRCFIFLLLSAAFRRSRGFFRCLYVIIAQVLRISNKKCKFCKNIPPASCSRADRVRAYRPKAVLGGLLMALPCRPDAMGTR